MNARQRRVWRRAVDRAAAVRVAEAQEIARDLLYRFGEPVHMGREYLRGTISADYAEDLRRRLM